MLNYDFLVQNKEIAIALLIIITVIFCIVFVKIMQKIGLEKVRKTAYEGFTYAERMFNHGENKEKFDYVIKLVQESIPKPFNFFITEKLLRKVVQLWFDLCKDLLDDGKLNGSIKNKN